VLASNLLSDSIFSLPSCGVCVSWPKAEVVVHESNRNMKKPILILVFKSVLVYKDLFLSVFRITDTKNKVRAKYMTKNINTASEEVFFAKKNQIRANIISSRNFRLTATRL
jgi:hypothetical protein